jgi:hypothetical protein
MDTLNSEILPNQTGNVRINVKTRCVRVTIFAVEKQLSITYSEGMSVALIMQHSKRSRRVILLSVVCLPVPYFSTLSQKGTTFDFLYKFRPKHFSF